VPFQHFQMNLFQWNTFVGENGRLLTSVDRIKTIRSSCIHRQHRTMRHLRRSSKWSLPQCCRNFWNEISLKTKQNSSWVELICSISWLLGNYLTSNKKCVNIFTYRKGLTLLQKTNLYFVMKWTSIRSDSDRFKKSNYFFNDTWAGMVFVVHMTLNSSFVPSRYFSWWLHTENKSIKVSITYQLSSTPIQSSSTCFHASVYQICR
jgi:hypothetical protein